MMFDTHHPITPHYTLGSGSLAHPLCAIWCNNLHNSISKNSLVSISLAIPHDVRQRYDVVQRLLMTRELHHLTLLRPTALMSLFLHRIPPKPFSDE